MFKLKSNSMKLISSFIIILALSITSLDAQLNQKIGRSPAVTSDWQDGYVNITEINGGMGLSITDVPYSKSYFGITNINGYQFSRNVKAGIGVGIQVHNGGTLIPVFADGRFSLSAQEVVPFFGIAGGVAFSPDELNSQSRVFINPSVGVKYVAGAKIGVSFSMGLMTQAGGSEARSSFISFRLGVEYKGKRWNF